MNEAYHLVCHDCTEEGVYEERGRAATVRRRHEQEVDHRTSLLAITDPRTDGRTEPADAAADRATDREDGDSDATERDATEQDAANVEPRA